MALGAPGLSRYISRYLEYDMAAWPARPHRGLPEGSLQLVLGLRDPIAVRDGASLVSAPVIVAGLGTRPVEILHTERSRGVQLSLTPLGARALLGLPAAELRDLSVPLPAVVGRRAEELVERVHEAETPAARARAVATVLAGWSAQTSELPGIERAWRLLRGHGGAMPVGALAGETGWSRRHLSTLFNAELGIGPKLAGQIVRFARACNCLRSGGTGLAEVAALCGYVDQPHLTADWRRFAGCTPSRWIAEELPFLQDDTRSRAPASPA